MLEGVTLSENLEEGREEEVGCIMISAVVMTWLIDVN